MDSSRTLPTDLNGDVLDDLIAYKALFAALLRLLNEGVIQVDESKCIVRFSPAAELQLGHTASGIIGSDFSDLLHPSNTADPFSAEDLSSISLILRDSAGSPVIVQARVLSIGQAPSEGWLLSIRGKERIEEIEQLKNELVSTISHELRTPLATIKAYTATLRQNPGLYENHREEFLGVVEQQADRLSRLVEDMLLVARVEGGQMLRRRVCVLLDSVLDLALRELRYDPVVHPVRREGTGIEVSGDPERLRDIFRNLLENAFKYSPDGGEVEIVGHQQSQQAVISIRDHGAGIAEEHLPYVFDRFFRGESHRNAQVGGSGLGLYIVQSLVRAHGGTIDVHSELGEGTTFTVRLPWR